MVPLPGYDWPPVVRITRRRMERPPRRGQAKAAPSRCRSRTRFLQGERRPAASQAAQQRVEHVGAPVADGKDLAGLLDLGGDAFGLEQLERVRTLRAARAECRKRPGGP